MFETFLLILYILSVRTVIERTVIGKYTVERTHDKVTDIGS